VTNGSKDSPVERSPARLGAGASEQVAVLRRAYRLFNDRRIDELLALLTEDVEWPDVANNAVLRGKEAIRPYWESQFAVAEPLVEPTDFKQSGDELVAVVDQRVLDKQGQLLFEAVVYHRYTFTLGLVSRMVVLSGPDGDLVGR
jgi:ketosteroid isomerase-like protein